ncbi:ATP-dependent Clp protease ATP-binding subunit [Corallococcus praedator]|uniref:ATP-dependent Clp protease ATP-binding subunit n=1 Tax=Corallococcus praedator TaxID=2316724 RepID=A0ABX9QKX5_9BACT|nr:MULTISPECIES: AAA family ATPase [Corallococcus]RKH18258.1 ATP-dependent Clp protease ATP-binding subunit [Corallococcus sp. CA047B]RKH32843.1 ATP-dependent Clp protease ATP-binding subunit [Corallococcus sp. CA031C]RKI11937.1 ATP-dependent Clp protease ATP-binding subunit [Corallococcus praedator]
MNFRFQCWVQRHASRRVTLTPLALPHLAVHADSLEKATEELTLALDDQLTRVHPRRVPEFIAAPDGVLHTLEVPGIPVWGAEENTVSPLHFSAVVAPAHQSFTGLHTPRLGTHLWFQGKALPPDATERLSEQLEGLSDARRLALRPEGQESLVELEVQATPTPLATLTPRQLRLDIRPPPRPPDAPAEKSDAAGLDDEDEDALDPDSWEPRRRSRRRDAGARPQKPPPTPTLDRIAVPWHALAQDGQLDPAYEQDALVTLLRARLAAKDAESVVLVGPSGVGKTAVLHALAQELRAPAGTASERARPFFFLDGSRLIAGEGMMGDWQQQVIRCLREAAESHAILSLGHAVDLLDAGKSAHSDQNVAQLLLPLLATREVSVVAEATPETWAQVERRNASFARLFSVVRVEEPSADALARILARVAEDDAGPKPLEVLPEALDEARFLCRRFLPYGAQVGNAVAFLRRLLATCAHAAQPRVTRLDAVRQFASESGIPESLLRDDVPLEPAGVRAFLSTRVLGQETAVERAAAVVSVLKAGLADTRRPLGVLLFVGPTGVGKTELSKALAELLFGAKERMVRLDMGEYAGPDALLRLLGDGETPGHLSSAVRRQPFCVVLLDEVEKAHPAVHDALLGVLGEGRLTDASGRFTDFRNAVLVLTSNLGADTWRARVGFDSSGGAPDTAALRAHYLAEVQRFFRPELFNRLDDVVVFSPLSQDLLRRLVVREVEAVCRRPGLSLHDAALEVAPSALDWLAARGFDPRYGARPLKRALERELVVPVAAWLAAHPRGGAVKLSVEAGDTGLALRAEAVGGDAEGVGRQAIEQVLEDAASLRAEVQRWSRCEPMLALRRELAVFDKASRQPAYWEERALAEASSRKSSEARELDKAFRDCAQQAEAVEDLLFEAHLTRAVGQAESLARDVAGLRRAFQPLRQRIHASLFPPSRGVTLLLVPGRGAWPHLCTLAKAYEAWAQAQSIAFQRALLLPEEPKDGEKPKPSRKDKDLRHKWSWEQKAELATLKRTPAAYALQLTSDTLPLLLAGEQGVHRFVEGSQAALVRVRFEPQPLALHALPALEDLEKSLTKEEVRRLRPSSSDLGGGSLEDLRTGAKQRYGSAGLDMEALLEAWLQWRVFGARKED